MSDNEIKAVAVSTFINEVPMQVLNGFFLMLILGGIGHRLDLSFLFIDYWTCVLIMLAVTIMFSPSSVVSPYCRAILKRL